MKGSNKSYRAQRHENDVRARRFLRRMVENGIPLRRLDHEFSTSTANLRNFYTGKTVHPRVKGLSDLIIMYYKNIFILSLNGKSRGRVNERDISTEEHREPPSQNQNVTALDTDTDSESITLESVQTPEGISFDVAGESPTTFSAPQSDDETQEAEEFQEIVEPSFTLEYNTISADPTLPRLREEVLRNSINALSASRDALVKRGRDFSRQDCQMIKSNFHSARDQGLQLITAEHHRKRDYYQREFSCILSNGYHESVIVSPESLQITLFYLDIRRDEMIETATEHWDSIIAGLDDKAKLDLAEFEQTVTRIFDENADALKKQIAEITTANELLQFTHYIQSLQNSVMPIEIERISEKEAAKLLRATVNNDRRQVSKEFSFPRLDRALRQAKYANAKTITDLSPEAIYPLMSYQ